MKKKSTKIIQVPYALSVHGDPEIRAVLRVLRGNTALGKHAQEFESKIAHLFGKKYGVMVNSGSSANLLAVELMDLPKGSEVITPLLTFATVVAPLLQKGLVPVFVDIDRGTYLSNLDQVESALTKRTKAIMIPSLIGNVPDLMRLQRFARKHNLFFIEDSCDTLGATYRGRPTGTYSDISTTSFYGSHIINGAGGGGMIMFHDRKLAERAIVMRGWGRNSSLMGESKASENIEKRFRARIGDIAYDAKFVFGEIGYNFLPLELSAAFALEQLKRFPVFQKQRRKHFDRLRTFFESYEEFFILPETTPRLKTSWLAFPLTIRPNTPFTRRDICTYFEQRGIQTRTVFTGNIMKQPAFKHMKARRALPRYPETELVMRSAFLVGCHQGLTSEQLRHLENVAADFLSQYI